MSTDFRYDGAHYCFPFTANADNTEISIAFHMRFIYLMSLYIYLPCNATLITDNIEIEVRSCFQDTMTFDDWFHWKRVMAGGALPALGKIYNRSLQLMTVETFSILIV